MEYKNFEELFSSDLTSLKESTKKKNLCCC